MLYPQFLFALMHVAEKRKSGFQEVVSRILAHNSAKPLASSADYIVYKNTGDPRQLREYVERPRGLPQLPVDNSAATKRMAREAEMAKSLGQMFRKPVRAHRGGRTGAGVSAHAQQGGGRLGGRVGRRLGWMRVQSRRRATGAAGRWAA
eukprot:351098-Chlamydomonas_euryale.AAC.1